MGSEEPFFGDQTPVPFPLDSEHCLLMGVRSLRRPCPLVVTLGTDSSHFILSQGQWCQTQSQHEDQKQGAQDHHHLFQQRLLPRAKGDVIEAQNRIAKLG